MHDFQLSNPTLSQESFFWRTIQKKTRKPKENQSKLEKKKKKKSKFSYCFTGLGAGCSTKEAIAASFAEHFNENQGNTICVYFAVII